jgi:glycosyltransferase involved in cell wall biosynthesis
MRILEVCGYPPPHNGWAVRIVQLKKRLDVEGHECVVLNTGESRRVPSPHYQTVENGWVYVRKLWRYCRRGFLVHAHANGEAPKGILLALIAQLIARWVGIGSVLTFHAGTDQVFFPRRRAPGWVPVFRLLFGLPRTIVCNSEAVKQNILEYGVPSSKVVPIPAFSRQYLDVAPVQLSEAIGRHFESYPRTLFCYLALRPVYHPNTVLQAFAELAAADPGLGLILCGLTGHPDGPVAEAFENTARHLDIEHRLCRVGDLTHDEFLTAMTRSLVYVRTHVSDGVCSSVLEALTLGIPVVAADNGTRPPGVVTYRPDDAEALARAIRGVLSAAAPSRARAFDSSGVPDTVRQEIDLLTAAAGAAHPSARQPVPEAPPIAM